MASSAIIIAAIAANRPTTKKSLHYETTSSRVIMFSNNGSHVHAEEARIRGLAEDVKEYIERKVAEGVVDLRPVLDGQVKNYLARVKKATNGGSMAITMNDLISMTEKHSQLPGAQEPSFIMADGAAAITAAAGEVFPASGRAMCWYHMKKNVESFMRGVQLATSQKAFLEMFRLFSAVHEPRHPELLKYIRESWVENPPYNTWWEGFAPRLPSTNNGLESMNNQFSAEPGGSWVQRGSK